MRPSMAKRAEVDAVPTLEGALAIEAHELGEPVAVVAKVAQLERVRLAHDREHVEREHSRRASEGLGRAIGEQHRVARRRRQIGAHAGRVEQRAQVVVLREEAVEAVLDGELLAERAHGPGGELAAELRGALDQRDVEVAGGELGGRGQPGQAATDDDDALFPRR